MIFFFSSFSVTFCFALFLVGESREVLQKARPENQENY